MKLLMIILGGLLTLTNCSTIKNSPLIDNSTSPINQTRQSKPGATIEEYYSTRFDCIEHHEKVYFSCMAAKGWKTDPKGFQPPQRR